MSLGAGAIEHCQVKLISFEPLAVLGFLVPIDTSETGLHVSMVMELERSIENILVTVNFFVSDENIR